MTKRYFSLAAAALFSAAALTLAPASVQGTTPELSPQHFKSPSKNGNGQTFWFPALYGTDITPATTTISFKSGDGFSNPTILPEQTNQAEFEEFVYTETTPASGDQGGSFVKNPSDPKGYFDYGLKVVEPTSNFSFKLKITKPAPTDGAGYGEVTIISAEFAEGFFGKTGSPNNLAIPEFVWATVDGSDALKHLVYRVTAVEPTVLDFLADDPDDDATKLKAFYFAASAPANQAKRSDYDAAVANGSVPADALTPVTEATVPFVALRFTPSIPAFSAPLKLHGILANGATEATGLNATRGEIFVTPTYYGDSDQAIFFGGGLKVAGADIVATQLGFGLSKDPRDITLTKADLANLVTALNSKGYGATNKTKTDAWKTSHLSLRIQGFSATAERPDKKKDILVTIADDALSSPGLGDAFASLSFEEGLAGDLGKAGFASIKATHYTKEKTAPSGFINGFKEISFSGANVKDNKPTLTFSGESLFAGDTIATLTLPAYLTEIGKVWFKKAKIETVKVSDSKGAIIDGSTTPGNIAVTSIADEAFAAATIPPLFSFYFGGSDANTVFADLPKTNLNPNTTKDGKPAVLSIGKAAFKGATITPVTNAAGDTISIYPLRFATSIGDEAFAGLLKKADKKPATIGKVGFSELKYIQSLGKDVFKNDAIVLAEASDNITLATSVTIGGDLVKTLLLPFGKYLSSAPAKALDSVTFVKDEAHTQKTDTILNRAFKFADNKIADAINKDAFYNDTIFVPFTAYEAWKAKLLGSIVIAYDVAPASGSKVTISDNWGTPKGPVPATSNTVSYYKLAYGFNDEGETARFINFNDAVKPDVTDPTYVPAAYYRIDGPKSAEGLFPESLGESHEIVKDKDGSFAISLPGGLPAGLYRIYTGTVSDQKAKTEADNTTVGDNPVTYPPAAILHIAPISLSDVAIDTIVRTWVGKDNFDKLLGNISLDDITIRNTYSGEEKFVTNSDVRLFPESNVEIPEANGHATVIKLRGLGNYTGEAGVILKYLPLDLATATLSLDDVSFTGSSKTYPYTAGKTVHASVHGFDVQLSIGKDADGVDVSLDYVAPAKPATVPATVTANPSAEWITGSAQTSYDVLATWAKVAAVNEKDGYNLGETVLFNGLPKTFEGLVKPLYLDDDDYALVAIPGTLTQKSYVDSLGEYIEGQLDSVGEYDFYIIPASEEYLATYAAKENAAYVGTLIYAPLPIDALIAAFEIGIEDGDYTLALDPEVYAGDFTAELNGDETAFTVTLPEEALAGIEGLEGESFDIAIPTALPTSLSFDQPVKTLYEGESYDLSQHLHADEGAKLDFLKDIEWTANKAGKIEVDETGFVTALVEWNGSVTATVKGTDVSATIAVNVILEDEDVPTSVVAASAAKSVTYANGKLTVKGYAGQTATLYRLNGTSAAKVAVTSDAASYDVKLTKGFYLVKTGTAITKIVVR
jgi:hypothetical protein